MPENSTFTCDNFSAHVNPPAVDLLRKAKIQSNFLVKNKTGCVQACDALVIKTLKRVFRSNSLAALVKKIENTMSAVSDGVVHHLSYVEMLRVLDVSVKEVNGMKTSKGVGIVTRAWQLVGMGQDPDARVQNTLSEILKGGSERYADINRDLVKEALEKPIKRRKNAQNKREAVAAAAIPAVATAVDAGGDEGDGSDSEYEYEHDLVECCGYEEDSDNLDEFVGLEALVCGGEYVSRSGRRVKWTTRASETVVRVGSDESDAEEEKWML
eukprot:GABV01008930.1.p1 GENE.GABV01008930.1~~GABV01008930.1.p1  ORF type:complete len:269 (+),score=80.82 GABV01008930.1:3-809(+)